jgi:hypothetical protein
MGASSGWSTQRPEQSGFAERAPPREDRLLSLRARDGREKNAQRDGAPAGDGVVDWRDRERVHGWIDGPSRSRIRGESRLQPLEIAEEGMREDVLLRPALEQQRLDSLTALPARHAECGHEHQLLDRSWLVHVDPAVEEELDNRETSRKRRELQQGRSVRHRRQHVGRAADQGAERWRVAAPREIERLARGLVAQARAVRARAQRRGLVPFVDERHREHGRLFQNRAARARVRDRSFERVPEVREPPARQRPSDGQEIVTVLERQIRERGVLGVSAQPFAEESFLGLAFGGEIVTEQGPQRSVAFDAIVQAVDERLDGDAAPDTSEESAAERAMSLAMIQESAVIHARQPLDARGVSLLEEATLTSRHGVARAPW